MAGDGGDDGFFDGGSQVGPGLDEGVEVGLGEGQGRHLLDVGAGGEGALGAGEEDGADGGGLLEGEEGGVEFGDEGGGEGVEGFGAVEGYCGVVLLVMGFVDHKGLGEGRTRLFHVTINRDRRNCVDDCCIQTK